MSDKEVMNYVGMILVPDVYCQNLNHQLLYSFYIYPSFRNNFLQYRKIIDQCVMLGLWHLADPGTLLKLL
jgi:hypothetical protein